MVQKCEILLRKHRIWKIHNEREEIWQASPTLAGIDAVSVKAASSLIKINNLGNLKNLGFDICEAIRRLDRTYFTV